MGNSSKIRFGRLIARWLARYAAVPVPSHKRSQVEFLQRCAQSMAQSPSALLWLRWARRAPRRACALATPASSSTPPCGFERMTGQGLEHLCRYLGRPALALRRLRIIAAILKPDIIEAIAAAIHLSQARARPPPRHTMSPS